MDKGKKIAGLGAADDALLVREFLNGCSRSFDRLVLKHQDRIFNVCFRLMGDYDEALDCAQETFIKVYRSLRGFRFESSFSTWLYRIAVNTCRNKLSSAKGRASMRRAKRGMKSSVDPADPVEVADASSSPNGALIRRESEALIQRALDALPGDMKTVVVLRDVQGISYEEIARITGFNLGTVKSKLSRAREKLRKELRGLL